MTWRQALTCIVRGGMAAVALLGAWCSAAAADGPRTVIWFDRGDAGAPGSKSAERERALRLELEARDIALLETSEPDSVDDQLAEQVAATLLERSGAGAVIWLEADPDRPVSWLKARSRASDTPAKAPLPHPPDAIETQLFAIAAASLADQVLGTVRKTERTQPPAPEQVAASAPAIAPLVEPDPNPAAPPPRPAARELHDLFVQLGPALTLANIRPGMEASSDAPLDAVYFEYEAALDPDGERTETRYLFDGSLPWVADADSFDDYEALEMGIPRGVTPLSSSCRADGTVTRAGELPSKFCARVAEPGFIPLPALRLAAGAWVTPELALTLVYQWHFTIDPERFFGAQSLGVEGQYLMVGERGRGFALALVAGISLGREETPVPSRNGDRDEVNALAGPLGASGGLAVRYAFGPTLALVATPSLGGRFPASQLTAELPIVLERSF